VDEIARSHPSWSEPTGQYDLNPSLAVIPLSWKLVENYGSPVQEPEKGDEIALVWRDPASGEVQMKAASGEDLFVLKVIAEEIPFADAAAEGGLTPGGLNDLLWDAVQQGLLLKPPPLIKRVVHGSREGKPADIEQVVDAFTLQWHITQACDLHCQHCYDRSSRSPLTLSDAETLMQDFYAFCHQRFVSGHICFSGGNPFLHPKFFDFYKMAVDMGFGVSLLANPVSRQELDRLVEIAPYGYFQVSLEGLQPHNDLIRGEGHFQKTLAFLDLLQEYPLDSAVMLTLTRDNMDQILPLGEILKGRVDVFNFNRLASFGEGANLALPDTANYQAFVREYVAAAMEDDLIQFKDNLINIELERRGLALTDGCTGFGCGAAFNFLAILPDGETHACRKFPSPVGNVLEQGITQVYDGAQAQRYRQGTQACSGCALVEFCGGCMAVTAGAGKDCFTERDPMCFFDKAPQTS
jgi:selenobiotic family peptide radical SAM maturase